MLEHAELIAARDCLASIDYLLQHKEVKGFKPWGYLKLADFQRRCGDRDKSLDVLMGLVLGHPIPAVLSRVLDVLRTRYEESCHYKYSLKAVCSEIVDYCIFNESIPEWFRKDIVFSIFILACFPNKTLSKSDFQQLSGKLELSLIDMRMLKSFFSFFSNTYPEFECDDFDSWVVGLSPNHGSRVSNRVYYVNLSDFEFPQDLSLLNREFLGVIVDLFIFKVRQKQFLDDNGLLTWGEVRRGDFNDVKIWQLIRSLIIKKYNDKNLSISVVYPENLLFDQGGFPGNLWVRAGCVELWALYSYFRDRVKFLSSAVDVAKEAESSKISSGVFGNSEVPFWPRLDERQNITNLITNAGWYSNYEHASDCLELWCVCYTEALVRGNLNHTVPEHLYTLLPFVPELREKKFFNWNLNRFFNFLKNKKVLFVTSYKNQINDSYVSGKLRSFWRDIGFEVDIKDLILVKSPMSVYPYTPDINWKKTFDQMLDECLGQCEKNGVNLVLAACGCYGLPLLNEINKRLGIDCVYYGHIMNMYFGIYTDAFKDFYSKNQSDNWVKGELTSEYPEISRIDSGRYV